MKVAGQKGHQHGPGDLEAKIAQRVATLPPPSGERLRVLDCFAGVHAIWDGVAALRPDVMVSHIEIDPKLRRPTDLPGDNLRYLRYTRLDRFAVIDLDAWGIPALQLALIAERGYRGIVAFTANQVYFGQPPHILLERLGIPLTWIESCPLLVKDCFEHLWFRYLATLGWPEVVVARDCRPTGAKGSGGTRRSIYGVVGHRQFDQALYWQTVRDLQAS